MKSDYQRNEREERTFIKVSFYEKILRNASVAVVPETQRICLQINIDM